MAYLSKDQVKNIIQKAPAGIPPQDIVAALEKQGHTLEGFNDQFSNQSKAQKVDLNPATGLIKGAAKGTVKTLKGISGIAEKGIKGVGKFFTPKSLEKKLGFEQAPISSAQSLQSKAESKLGLQQGSITTAITPAQKVGMFLEQASEFFVPGTQSVKVGKAVTGLAKGKNLIGLGAKALTEGAQVGSIAAAQEQGGENEVGDRTLTSALIATALPIFGAGLSVLRPAASKAFEKGGEGILTRNIKPGPRGKEEGFDVKNLSKYKVIGKDLSDTFQKTTLAINSRLDKLKSIINQSKDKINLTEAYEETTRRLTGNPKFFGSNTGIKTQLSHLKKELEEIAPIGRNEVSLLRKIDTLGDVDLHLAQVVKQGAGTRGAWSRGLPDKDSTAIEKVYTTFYDVMKEKIEKTSPDNIIGKINKEISELIPVSNALVRRIPIEERKNVLDLTETITLASSMFNPKLLALFGAEKLSKSQRFADYLIKSANKLKNTPQRRAFRRVRERLFEL